MDREWDKASDECVLWYVKAGYTTEYIGLMLDRSEKSVKDRWKCLVSEMNVQKKDSIQIEYSLYGTETLQRTRTDTIALRREEVDKVTVVSNGFTCEMDADHFFKIIHEAFQW
jgi:hypothetical protein